jgi:4-alpha-glucanotransferase
VEAPNATHGEWIGAPGFHFFNTLKNYLGDLPFFAEDLGFITPDVVELRTAFNFPGMNILQFAFDAKEKEAQLPYTYTQNSVTYTGTHDNDTTRGWFQRLKKNDALFVCRYLNCSPKQLVWSMIRQAWASPSFLSITPMQDLLNLGNSARINIPGVFKNIYRWKLDKNLLSKKLALRLRELTEVYGRAGTTKA